MEKIALLGMMGSGKTTVGRKVAELLSIPFVDADARIEESSGSTIADMFNRDGEEAFRRREREVLRELLASPGPLVMALGGGAFQQEGVREDLRGKAMCVYLRVKPDELVRRLEGTDIPFRPMLRAAGDWRERARELAAERDPVYMNADVIFPADGNDPEALGELLTQVLRRLCPRRRDAGAAAERPLEAAHA